MGGRSRAAAQLMAGQGFNEVYNLKGGIKAWHGLTASGPFDMGMDFVKGDETIKDIIIIAYGMESGLSEFYLSMAKTADDTEVEGVLEKLAGIEQSHKQKLFDLYLALDPAATDREAFESKIVSHVMEGGFTTEEFIEKNRRAMETIADVLNIAMMLETQALDLYLRYSQKTKEEKSKSVLYEIAQEEKAHLATLGKLMDASMPLH